MAPFAALRPGSRVSAAALDAARLPSHGAYALDVRWEARRRRFRRFRRAVRRHAPERVAARLTTDGLEPLTQAAADGRGAILLSTHGGPPEGISVALRAVGFDVLELREATPPPWDPPMRVTGFPNDAPAEVRTRALLEAARDLRRGGLVRIAFEGHGARVHEHGHGARIGALALPIAGGAAALARSTGAPTFCVTASLSPLGRLHLRLGEPWALPRPATLERGSVGRTLCRDGQRAPRPADRGRSRRPGPTAPVGARDPDVDAGHRGARPEAPRGAHVTASLLDALRTSLAAFGDRCAIEETAHAATERCSGREVLRRVEAAAAALRAAGVASGDVVSVHADAAIPALCASLAVRSLDAVPFLSGSAESPPELASVSWSPDTGPRRVREPGSARLPAAVAWLRATGGTTGRARIAGFSDAAALAAAVRSGAALGPEPSGPVVTTLSPRTGYGWNSGFAGPWLGGWTVIVVPPVSPSGVLLARLSHAAAAIVTTPPVVRALARAAVPAGTTSARPTRVYVAGSAYPDDDARIVLERHGLAVLDRYGSTESGLVAQAREPGGPLWPVPDMAVRGVGDPPTIEVRGPGLAWGYVASDERPAAPFDGVWATADRIVAAADGSFRLRGRADRVVKRAGRPVDLAAIERVLAARPGIALASVRSQPGELDLEIVAEVVPRPGVVLDAGELARDLAGCLPPWERPSTIRVLEQAPDAGWGKWSGVGTS